MTSPTLDPAVAALTGGLIQPGGGAGSKTDPYNLSGLAGAQIDGAALFGPGALTGTGGFMTPEQAVYNFGHADPNVRAAIQLAMWKAGFYGASTQVADLNLGSKYLKSDDFSAFVHFLASAVDAGGQQPDQAGNPAGVFKTPPLRDYLQTVAGIGDQYGGSAAQGYLQGQAQQNKPDLRAISTTDPAGVRASLRAAYQAAVGRDPTHSEFAAFTAAFTGAQRAAQMTPYQIGDAQTAYFEGQYQTDPVTGMPVVPDQTPKPRPEGRVAADETQAGGLSDQPLPPGTTDPADAQAAAFLSVLSGGVESSGDPHAQAKLSSASGSFGITDKTWGGYGGYTHAKDAPPQVQFARAKQLVLGKLAEYGGDWRKVAMSWYLPAAVNNPALANSIPAPQAGNRLTPNQYADLIIGRMSRATNVAFTASQATYPGGQQPVYYNVSTPDLGARAVEDAMRRHPAEYGAHAAAATMDNLLAILSGSL